LVVSKHLLSSPAHPLMCTRRCGFNFCVNCIESLMQSSEDDYLEASDGNKHVKVFLHCPNCRSDLGPTIRDTVLLRKVDNCHGLADEELTSRQVRLRKAMDTDARVQRAIADARLKEAKFFANRAVDETHDDSSALRNLSNDSWLSDHDDDYEDEWGVEADDVIGPHEEKHPKEFWGEQHSIKIDSSLLAGLESALTTEDQRLLTKYMTSGDTCKLATAAKILSGIADAVHEGMKPSRSIAPRSSVYRLIEDAEKARHTKKPAAKANHAKPRVTRPIHQNPAVLKAQQHKIMEQKLRRQLAYMQLHPLPVRMPKYVEFNMCAVEDLPFTFCDDTWDGTVMDAFSKIYISGNHNVTKKRQQNRGVRNVLDAGSQADCGDVRIDTEHPRVLIASVEYEGGRRGIMLGDVVTHLNGEEMVGTVDDLVNKIQVCRERGDKSLRFVLNAERSAAEALKLRALAK